MPVSSFRGVPLVRAKRVITPERETPMRMPPVSLDGLQMTRQSQTAIEPTVVPVSTVIMMPSDASTQSTTTSLFGQYEDEISKKRRKMWESGNDTRCHVYFNDCRACDFRCTRDGFRHANYGFRCFPGSNLLRLMDGHVGCQG